MFWSILLYIVLGFLLDLFITLHQRAIILERPLWAAILTFVITVSSVGAYKLMVNHTILYTLAFAFGCSLGTLAGMIRKNMLDK